MYNIPSLSRAVSELTEAREARLALAAQPVKLNDTYRAMFARMGAIAPEKAEGLGYCLEPREKAILCEYLFTEAQDSEKGTLGNALLEELDIDSAGFIYEKCLENYADEAFRPMFKKLHTSLSFVTAVEEKYGFKAEPLLDAMAKGALVEYINTEAGYAVKHIRHAKDESADSSTEQAKSSAFVNNPTSYLDALERFGIRQGTPLYRKCAELYVVVCDAAEYRKLGVEKLTEMSAEFDDEDKGRLLRNMLNAMDDFQLQAFVPMLEEFIALTGEKGSGSYREILGGVSAANVDKYELWAGKYKIHKVLGDSPIAKFWYDYAGDAAFMQYEHLKTLVIDFGSFMVIEIRDNEAAYFYNVEYFRDVVMPGIAEAKSPEELEDWLLNKTKWSAGSDRENHWRKAHLGQWQLAFKEYIWKYDRG